MIKSRRARGMLLRCATVATCATALAACGGLPVSGPTGLDIRRAGRQAAAAGQAATLPFRVIEVADASLVPPAPLIPRSPLAVPLAPPTDLIGPGDTLHV